MPNFKNKAIHKPLENRFITTNKKTNSKTIFENANSLFETGYIFNIE
jgi:hypothetical protein